MSDATTLTRVELTCPRCRYTWHAATIDYDAWWSKGVTPVSIAAICYCPHCNASPPMHIVSAQLPLFSREGEHS